MRGVIRQKAGACATALLAGSALTLLTGAAPAGAAPGAGTAPGTGSAWTIQKSPDVTLPTGQINAVSCWSARACTAVGNDQTRTGRDITLAEAWHGTSWKVQRTPDPAGGSPGFTGVSCPAAGFCAAVGSYSNPRTLLGTPFAEVWNGRSWTSVPVPVPAGAPSAALSGVSCVSADFCAAVGSAVNSSGTQLYFAESWNGTAWRIQPVPSPSGAPFAVLNGVSCVSATFCAAVGAFPATAVLWNGTAWQLSAMPSGAGVGAVSCASADFCEAVGGTRATAWNGSTWTAQPVPIPAGATSAVLYGVSCATAGFCAAMGSDGAGSPSLTLGETWNGTSWSVQSTPDPAGAAYAAFRGVSCAAAGNCEAAGYFELSEHNQVLRPMAEAWNGTSWQAQQVVRRDGPVASDLSAVSCVSARFCEAVGTHADSVGGTVGLAEVRHGTSWSIQPTPDPARMTSVRLTLNGVSCVSRHFCEAVGYSAGGRPGAGGEEWTGSAWQPQAIPGSAYLTAVSCVSADFCAAVGGNGGADTWNGTTWSAVAPPPGFSSLTSVSCTSPDFCEATGPGPAGEEAAAWNGTSWSAQATPAPAGGNSLGLTAVSCAAAASCEAVGSYNLQSTGQAVILAEAWNGSAWSVQPTPDPTASLGSYLRAVSCTSAASCAAVGEFSRSTPYLALVETWNGTAWSLGSAADQPGAGQNVLNGVSCVPGGCTAAGDTNDAAGAAATLVETGG